jgi:hypothetical protein
VGGGEEERLATAVSRGWWPANRQREPERRFDQKLHGLTGKQTRFSASECLSRRQHSGPEAWERRDWLASP